MNSRIQTSATRLQARVPSQRAQRGVVMFVALVVLIVMTLAGLAMLRQMGSGVSIAGNIAFKQGATAVADAGIEAGRAWLTTAPTLNADVPANGYYATWVGNVDPTSADWLPMWNAVPDTLVTNSGSVRFIVQRLCALPGPSSGGAQQCSDSVDTSRGGSGMSGADYTTGGVFKFRATPFYRVTARVLGPRNTVSYTQVVLN